MSNPVEASWEGCHCGSDSSNLKLIDSSRLRSSRRCCCCSQGDCQSRGGHKDFNKHAVFVGVARPWPAVREFHDSYTRNARDTDLAVRVRTAVQRGQAYRFVRCGFCEAILIGVDSDLRCSNTFVRTTSQTVPTSCSRASPGRPRRPQRAK